MKLNLSNLAKYSKVISRISSPGHPAYESLYFDFPRSMVFAQSPLFMTAGVKISMELEEGETLESFANFYVPTGKLLSAIARDCENVSLSVDGTFSLGNGDRAKLPVQEDALFDPPVVFPEESEAQWKLEGDEILTSLKKAITYASQEINDPQNGIFVVNNQMRAAADTVFFTSPLSTSVADLALPLHCAKLVPQIMTNSGEGVAVAQNENAVNVWNGEIGLITGRPNNLEMGDFDDPEFVEAYKVANYIVVDQVAILNELKYLHPFYSESPSTRIRLSIEDGFLHMSVLDQSEVHTKVEISAFSDGFTLNEDQYFWIPGTEMRKAVTDLDAGEEGVIIRLADDADSLTFEDSKETTIVESILEE